MNEPTRPQIDALITATFNKKKGERVDNYYLPADATPEEHHDLINATEEYYHYLQHQHLNKRLSNGSITKRLRFSKYPEGREAHNLYALFAEHNLNPPPTGSEDFTYTVKGLREAEQEVARLELARLQGADPHELTPLGRFHPNYIAYQVPHGLHTQSSKQDLRATIADCIEGLTEQKLRTGHWRQGTLVEHRPKLLAFSSFMEKRYPNKVLYIDEVSYEDLRAYHEHLKELPANNKKGDALSFNSVKGYMGITGRLLKFAKHRGFITFSPYEADLFASKKKPGETKRYRDFTKQEITKFFGSPEYNDLRQYGKTSNWWMPLLGLLTGARQGELIELRLTDIREVAGEHFIDINNEDGKEVKNEGSLRQIPIHPDLVELGFLEFVAKLRRGQSKYLFPDAFTKAVSAQVGYSRRFARLMAALGMNGDNLVYHSFRHTFISQMRAADVREEHLKTITGHIGKKDAHDGYGNKKPVAVLAPALATLDYGINWKTLLIPQDKPKTNKRKSSPYRKQKNRGLNA